MRMVLVLLCLEGAFAFAQIGSSGSYNPGPQLQWTLGAHRSQPTLTATAAGSRNGLSSLVDTDADLGLQRTGTSYGGLVEYSGQTHGFRLAYDGFRQEGERVMGRDVYLDGTPYAAGTALRSKAKVTVLEGIYTYKFVQRSDAWLGLDLGAQYLKADLSAEVLSATPTTQTASPTLPVPQVGISGWSSGADGLLESRVYYHYFTHRGATSHRYGLDARAYLYPSFGLRAFYDVCKIKIPAGSTEGDLDFQLDSKMTGVGLVIRF